MKWIVFDLDDVLCNFRESLYQSFLKNNIDIHWSQWSIYVDISLFGLNSQIDFQKHMMNHLVLENAEIEDYAFELLANIKKEGFKIGLLTARGWHYQGLKITENFVNKYQLPVDRIIVSNSYKDRKSAYIEHFEGEIHSYLDDSVHHVEDFISQKIDNTYLLDRPWNKISNLPKVNDLLDFEKTILNQLKSF